MTSQLSEGFPAHFCLLPGMVLPGHYLLPPPPPLSVRVISQTLVYEESYNLGKHLNPLSKSMQNMMEKNADRPSASGHGIDIIFWQQYELLCGFGDRSIRGLSVAISCAHKCVKVEGLAGKHSGSVDTGHLTLV